MATQKSSAQYHAGTEGYDWSINFASDEELLTWASDPNCIEKDKCAAVWAEREKGFATRRTVLQQNPFNPCTEVSADAKHVAGQVVKHLWIIFVLMPFVAFVLYFILASLK